MAAVQYYIVDLGKSFIHGRLVLQHSLRAGGGTCELARARQVPEEEVNAALDRYDNGSTTRAILCEVIDQMAFNGTTFAIPHRELLGLCKRVAEEQQASNQQRISA
ncbi:hypothetical protein [Marinobacterium rhizophilum]|uniref:Uncharacterized protein n=1 Tax=Marinobacterium rhizophilum TaxID=420402 RepID=A0ABY5HM45_9GAMM|nr:hypothetical protein [Marinobacterium rhizophilum]UTW12956.1 hypothetical protein KDW95_04580 [Marinobacterium rhizophilum]